MNIPSFVKLLALPILLGTFIFCNKGGTVEPGETEYMPACKSPHYYMLSDFKSGHASILSPDRKSQVLLTKSFSYEVFHEGRGIGTVPPFADVYSNVQVMWAPDSAKFSITYSDSSEIGAFYVHLYEVHAKGLTEFTKPPHIAFDDFKKKYYCAERGDNIVTLGWTPDSRLVFLVGEVFPTSDCGDISGREGGYLVDLDGRIIYRYDDKQTMAIEMACRKSSEALLPSPRGVNP